MSTTRHFEAAFATVIEAHLLQDGYKLSARDRCVREREKYIAGNGQIAPSCPAAVWWLGQRLARMA